jgi:hypothetical protein
MRRGAEQISLATIGASNKDEKIAAPNRASRCLPIGIRRASRCVMRHRGAGVPRRVAPARSLC